MEKDHDKRYLSLRDNWRVKLEKKKIRREKRLI